MAWFSTGKPVKALPFPVYFGAVAVLAIAGLADSIYLAISHYRVHVDIGYSSFCAISRAINCDTVSQSPYAIMLGVPVPLWGVMGYLGYVLIMIKGWKARNQGKPGWALLQVVALLFSVYSVVLAVVSTYAIRSYCIMCILSYGINLMLLFYTWIIRKRFMLPSLVPGTLEDIKWLGVSRSARWTGAIFSAAAIWGVVAFPAYWHYEARMPLTTIATGVTETGHPWIGAEKPVLEIVEFTDYQCFQCRKMHRFLRQLIAEYPDRIRLVHRNFPMDHKYNPIVKTPFHVGSGRMALLALYAAETDKFWEMNDALFAAAEKKDGLGLRGLARTLGVELPELQRAVSVRRDLQLKLAEDIRGALKLGITGTPAYVVDGEVFLAQIPPDILRRVDSWHEPRNPDNPAH